MVSTKRILNLCHQPWITRHLSTSEKELVRRLTNGNDTINEEEQAMLGIIRVIASFADRIHKEKELEKNERINRATQADPTKEEETGKAHCLLVDGINNSQPRLLWSS